MRPLGAARFCGFDQDRECRKPRIPQQPAERFQAEAPVADVLVPIDTAAAWLLRIVAVEDLQPVEADPLDVRNLETLRRLRRAAAGSAMLKG